MVLNRFHAWFFFILAAPVEALQGHSSLNVYCAQLFFVSVCSIYMMFYVICVSFPIQIEIPVVEDWKEKYG